MESMSDKPKVFDNDLIDNHGRHLSNEVIDIVLNLPVVPELAKYMPEIGDDEGDPFPKNLIGSSIVWIGLLPKSVDRNTLVIDYRPSGDGDVRRMLLSFTDQRIWLTSAGELHLTAMSYLLHQKVITQKEYFERLYTR